MLAIVDDPAVTPVTQKVSLTNLAVFLAALAETLTNKTLTSPIVSGAGGTTAGKQGYDATNLALLIGDGTAIQSLFTSAWKAFTPTWVNITVGNGTNGGAYAQIGKVILFRARLVLGSTSTIDGAIGVTLPVAIKNIGATMPIGRVVLTDTGTNNFYGFVWQDGEIYVYNASGTYLTGTAVNATTPFTWVSTDIIEIYGAYEAN